MFVFLVLLLFGVRIFMFMFIVVVIVIVRDPIKKDEKLFIKILFKPIMMISRSKSF